MVESADRVPTDMALFVFVPFCKIKCTYCDFNAYANLARVMDPYIDSVALEISNFGEWHLPQSANADGMSAFGRSSGRLWQPPASTSHLTVLPHQPSASGFCR